MPRPHPFSYLLPWWLDRSLGWSNKVHARTTRTWTYIRQTCANHPAARTPSPRHHTLRHFHVFSLTRIHTRSCLVRDYIITDRGATKWLSIWWCTRDQSFWGSIHTLRHAYSLYSRRASDRGNDARAMPVACDIMRCDTLCWCNACNARACNAACFAAIRSCDTAVPVVRQYDTMRCRARTCVRAMRTCVLCRARYVRAMRACVRAMRAMHDATACVLCRSTYVHACAMRWACVAMRTMHYGAIRCSHWCDTCMRRVDALECVHVQYCLCIRIRTMQFNTYGVLVRARYGTAMRAMQCAMLIRAIRDAC
jgi:hypothetical protein